MDRGFLDGSDAHGAALISPRTHAKRPRRESDAQSACSPSIYLGRGAGEREIAATSRASTTDARVLYYVSTEDPLPRFG